MNLKFCKQNFLGIWKNGLRYLYAVNYMDVVYRGGMGELEPMYQGWSKIPVSSQETGANVQRASQGLAAAEFVESAGCTTSLTHLPFFLNLEAAT